MNLFYGIFIEKFGLGKKKFSKIFILFLKSCLCKNYSQIYDRLFRERIPFK